MDFRPYQQEIYFRALPVFIKQKLVYLALETRLGKTLLALRLADACPLRLPILFITKKKAIKSIQSDYEQSGVTRPIKIISMDSIHLEPLLDRIVVVDEAHNFGKYPKPSKRARELRRITEHCYCILLSATPAPESWSQIYHQLWACRWQNHFITMYKNFYAWAREYVKMIETTNQLTGEPMRVFPQKYISAGVTVCDYGQALMDKIKERISDIMITMTQKEAGFNFTEFKETFINCPMPERLISIYNTIRDSGYINLANPPYVTDKEIIAETAAMLMSKLHQIGSGTVIEDTWGGHMLLSRFKIDAIYELMDKYDKLVVFYKFVAERSILDAYLGDFWSDEYIYTSDWQEFNNSKRAIFVSQFLSGREGINLESAQALVFYNIDFAFLSYEQTKNRIQKIDREHQPELIWLFSDKGLEKSIYKRVCKKKNYTVKFFEKEVLHVR